MVLLEIATLIMAGVGLADYYHTTVYRENLRQLKTKYGEHPDIDEAFEDICTLGGECFEMPKLELDSQLPRINMGSFYEPNSHGPIQVLEEFFVTDDDIYYFCNKYEKEWKRQRNIRNEALESMYPKVKAFYDNEEYKTINTKNMTTRTFNAPPMIAKNKEKYKKIINHISKNTLWKDIFEAGPRIYGSQFYYTSKWLIKEDIFNKIQCNEVYEVLFEACYYHYKHKPP